ncbi:MAG: glycosyltransferase family 2 protein [Caulobacteraceae bacterium]
MNPLADTDEVEIIDNTAWSVARPGAARLSVLIPFYRDDPRRLLAALDREADQLGGEVEVVVLDDAGGDAGLSADAAEAVEAMRLPARLLRLTRNGGRAKGRNRLTSHGRARHFLFLDSDMLPDHATFLSVYLDLIRADDPPVVFGGFSVSQAPPAAEHGLHRALASRADCLSAETRGRTPEKYVFTSNLLVRRDVFDAEAFDESFSGWGWEDVEWGVRVSRRYGVRHIENTATHMGLDTALALACKYEQSAGNFARLATRHPDIVSTYPSYRLANMLKHVPAHGVWRPLLKSVALHAGAPMGARVAAMKVYRAALYAEAL